MLIISANREQLDDKKENMKVIYGPKWALVLGFLCGCHHNHIRDVFTWNEKLNRPKRRDNLDIIKTADYLITRGENIPKKVEAFLKTVRYGKLRRK